MSEYACCGRCGFSLEENLAQLHALRQQIEEAQQELRDWEDLVAGSAPLTWAATGDVDAATAWEKRAADMLAKRAKLLTLGGVSAPT